MKAKKPISRAQKYARLSIGTVLAFLAVTVLFNVIVYRLADHFGWYFYTEEPYAYEVDTDVTDRLLSGVRPTERVTVLFCRTPDELTSSWESELVYTTAKTVCDRYEFLNIETISLWSNPDRVKKYRTTEDGERVSIDTSSVIVDAGDQFTVLSMRDFYVLDDNDYIMCFDGAERLCAAVMWVLADEHPIAYFTANHGEISTRSFYYMLTFAGYEIRTINLYNETPVAAGSILVIANPLYDFEKSAEGATYRAEIDKIEHFVADGGSLFLLLDRGAYSLSNLSAMIARMGMTLRDATVRDMTGSITVDGYTITTVYGDVPAITEKAGARGGRVIARNACPITLSDTENYTTDAVLYSGDSSALYAGGASIDGEGSYPVAALASHKTGGKVFLVSAEKFATYDTIETNAYANEDLIYAVFEECSGRPSARGFDLLVLDTETIEDMTRGEANLFAVLFIGVLPLAVAVTGIVLCLRRRYR